MWIGFALFNCEGLDHRLKSWYIFSHMYSGL